MTELNMKAAPPVVTDFAIITNPKKYDAAEIYREKKAMLHQSENLYKSTHKKIMKKKDNEVLKFIAGVGIAFLAICGLKKFGHKIPLVKRLIH